MIYFIGIIVLIIISYLIFKKQKPIIYFPDGSHINPKLNDKLKYLIQNSKHELYVDDDLICVGNKIWTFNEYIDGDYCMIPELKYETKYLIDVSAHELYVDEY